MFNFEFIGKLTKELEDSKVIYNPFDFDSAYFSYFGFEGGNMSESIGVALFHIGEPIGVELIYIDNEVHSFSERHDFEIGKELNSLKVQQDLYISKMYNADSEVFLAQCLLSDERNQVEEFCVMMERANGKMNLDKLSLGVLPIEFNISAIAYRGTINTKEEFFKKYFKRSAREKDREMGFIEEYSSELNKEALLGTIRATIADLKVKEELGLWVKE